MSRFAVLGLGLLAFLGLSLLAGSAAAGSLETFNVCVKKKNPDKGTVRYIGTATSCKKGEKLDPGRVL